MPTRTERELIQSLEDQAALINRFLEHLRRQVARASDAAELGRVHRLRDDAQRRLATSEGKGKRGDA